MKTWFAVGAFLFVCLGREQMGQVMGTVNQSELLRFIAFEISEETMRGVRPNPRIVFMPPET